MLSSDSKMKCLCVTFLLAVFAPIVFGKQGYSHQHVHNPGYGGHGGGHGGYEGGYAHPKYSFSYAFYKIAKNVNTL